MQVIGFCVRSRSNYFLPDTPAQFRAQCHIRKKRRSRNGAHISLALVCVVAVANLNMQKLKWELKVDTDSSPNPYSELLISLQTSLMSVWCCPLEDAETHFTKDQFLLRYAYERCVKGHNPHRPHIKQLHWFYSIIPKIKWTAFFNARDLEIVQLIHCIFTVLQTEGNEMQQCNRNDEECRKDNNKNFSSPRWFTHKSLFSVSRFDTIVKVHKLNWPDSISGVID